MSRAGGSSGQLGPRRHPTVVACASLAHSSASRSLVARVEDLLLSLEASVGEAQSGLVERLRLVEVVPVGGPNLVSVGILLGLPGGAVPELAVALVARGEGVGALVDLELRAVLERNCVVTVPPVGAVVLRRAQVGRARGRREVVERLVVRGRVEHRARAVAAGADLEGLVVPRDQLLVESKQIETVKL